MARSLQIVQYTTGTITIASVSSVWTVTGSGTNFLSPDGVTNWTVAVGDMLICGGQFGIVGSVVSATGLTLSYWSGSAVSSAASYAINRLTPIASTLIAGLVQQLLAMGSDSSPDPYLTIDTGAVRFKFDDDGSGDMRLRVRASGASGGDSAYVTALTVDDALGAPTFNSLTVNTSAVKFKMDDDGSGNMRFRIRASGAGGGDSAYVTAFTINDSTGAVSFGGGQRTPWRNRLVNARFDINQLAVSGTVTLAAGAWGHDNVKAGAGGATYTFSYSNYYTTITLTSGTLIIPIEPEWIEGGSYILSQGGTSTARVWQGTGYTGSGSYATCPFVVTGLTADTQTNVEFSTGTIYLPQLEAGASTTLVTPFEFRPDAIEMTLCQRYFQTGISGLAVPSTSAYTYYAFQMLQPMRSSPTLSSTYISGYAFPTTNPTLTALSYPYSFEASAVANATSNGAFLEFSWKASARLN